MRRSCSRPYSRVNRRSLENWLTKRFSRSEASEIVLVRGHRALLDVRASLLPPFIGKAHVSDQTGEKWWVVEVARIVDMFARRLQIQENPNDAGRRCAQRIPNLASARSPVLSSSRVTSLHDDARGVEKQNSVMTTSCLLGVFRGGLLAPSSVPRAAERIGPVGKRWLCHLTK